jgi:phosphopantetheinyl transferase
VGSRRRRLVAEVLLASRDPSTALGVEDLSHEERSRASAIADPFERRRYHAGRRLLRHALSQRTGLPPGSLQIASGPNGQAFLIGDGPFFSLAHTGRWHALALCDGAAVGTALAAPAERRALDAVPSALLPPRAREEIAATPRPGRAEVTLRWWLAMEAAARACGEGRDRAAECLSRVTTATTQPMSGLIVAVAACTDRPLDVRCRVIDGATAGAPAA